MAKIFLSYRRQDSAGVAGRIYDRLRAHFGNDAIFMDIDSIPFGVDFREHITAALDQCGILLAVIGRQWAGTPYSARSARRKRRMPAPDRGEVWIVDLGMAGKVRPCVVLKRR